MAEIPVLEKVFDHVSISVTDIEAATRFYVDMLGFEQIDRPDFGFPGAWLTISGTPVHLTTGGSVRGEDAPLRPNDPHFAVAVAGDLDQFLKALQTHGVRTFELQDSPAAERQTFVMDPDGNVIEFCVYRAA